MFVILKYLGLAWFARPKRLGMTTILDPRAWVKKIKILQHHDWTAKTNTASFKQNFLLICNRT
jgi:hypothetical protein